MPRIRLKRLREKWGDFDPNNGQITLDKKLEKKARPSKDAVYWHEIFHEYQKEKGVTIYGYDAEFKCELYSLMKCKAAQLSFLEKWLKKQIIKKYGRLSKKQILELKDFSLIEDKE